MRILLTGAAGFVGAACLRSMQELGWDVVTTDRGGSVMLVGDLADAQFCDTLPEVDAVVHCAAVQYVTREMPFLRRQRWFQQNNVVATQRLCDRYRRYPATYLLNIGTSMMYAQTGAGEYSTHRPFAAQGAYSESKLAAYRAVGALPNPKVTVIPCIVGGAGRQGLFVGFVNSIKRFGGVPIPGGGIHKTAMVHVEDLARLVVLALRKRPTGLLNAAAPYPLSPRDWVYEVAAALGLPKPMIWDVPLAPLRLASILSGYRLLAREQLLMLAQSHTLDTSDSMALGWKPEHDNAKIVRDIAKAIERGPDSTR